MNKNIWITLLFIALALPSYSQKLIDEDFTDGAFNNFGAGENGKNWEKRGIACDFREPNNRPFPLALSNQISLNPTAGGWDNGALWEPWEDLNNNGILDEGERKYFDINKENDIPFVRFTVFSDFLNKNNYAGVEVAFLEHRIELDNNVDYKHDLSFETMTCFYRTVQASCGKPHQLETNVENTENCDATIFNYAHKNGWYSESTDLDQSFTNLVLWRNEKTIKKVNIEQCGNIACGEFMVDTHFVAKLDPYNENAKFSKIQITFFRGQAEQTSQKFRPGTNYSTAQIGITKIEAGIVKRADFNFDYSVNFKDADTLLKYLNTNNTLLLNGDANNDGNTDLQDANPLIAFWDTATSTIASASGNYNPTNGNITLNLNGISYFHIEGPDNSLNKSVINLDLLPNIANLSKHNYMGALTKNEWNNKATINLGNIAVTGLQPSDLYLVINYKKSGQNKGIRIPLDGTPYITNVQPKMANPNETVKIFPNPVHDNIHLNGLTSSNNNYKIYNSMGMIVQQGMVTDSEVNVSSLTNGLFILEVYSQNQPIIREQFIKK